MEKREKSWTLRAQILCLVSVSVMVVFLSALIFLSSIVGTNQNQMDKKVRQSAELLEAEVLSYCSEIEDIAALVAYNGLTLKLSKTRDLSRMTVIAKDIDDMLDIIASSNQNVSGMIVTDFGHVALGMESSDFTTYYAARDYIMGHPEENYGHFSFWHSELECQEYLYFQKSLSSSKGTQYYAIVIDNVDVIRDFVDRLNQDGEYQVIGGQGELVAGNLSHGQTENANIALGLEKLGWTIEGYSRSYAHSARFSTLVKIGTVMLVAFTGWVLMMMRLLIKNITAPITLITEFIRTYPENSTKRERIQIPLRNEVSQIGEGINEMLDELETTSSNLLAAKETIYRTRIEKQRSELIALQIQVNPHFLFNTLNCINGIAVSHGENEISETVVAMASILRYSLGGEKFVPLAEEIESIRDYCAIIKVRFQSKVQIEYEIDEIAENMVIPKMILQPVTENAVSHGLEACYGKGMLWIRALRKGEGLEITIENTGEPIPAERVEEINRYVERDVCEGEDVIGASSHIGLRNVHARLRILCGEGAGVHFAARKGGGAVVTLKITREACIRDTTDTKAR